MTLKNDEEDSDEKYTLEFKKCIDSYVCIDKIQMLSKKTEKSKLSDEEIQCTYISVEDIKKSVSIYELSLRGSQK